MRAGEGARTLAQKRNRLIALPEHSLHRKKVHAHAYAPDTDPAAWNTWKVANVEPLLIGFSIRSIASENAMTMSAEPNVDNCREEQSKQHFCLGCLLGLFKSCGILL